MSRQQAHADMNAAEDLLQGEWQDTPYMVLRVVLLLVSAVLQVLLAIEQAIRDHTKHVR